MTRLGKQTIKTSLSLGTICIYLTLPVTHATFTCVLRRTFSIWTSCWDSDTALLRRGDTGKSFRAGALDIITGYLAKGVWPTGTFLLTRVDTFETDTHLFGRAVFIVSATNGANTIATDLAAWALLARDAGDHAHAVTALFSNQTVIRSWGIAALASP